MLVSVYFHTHTHPHPHPLSTANIEISIVFHNLLRIKTHISATIGLGIVPIEIIQFFLLTTGKKGTFELECHFWQYPGENSGWLAD